MESQEQPSDTLTVRFTALDAATGEMIRPVYVEIVDERRCLRAAGWQNKNMSNNQAKREFEESYGFILPYTEDENFLAKVVAGEKVGFTTFGTAPGASQLYGSRMKSRSGRRVAVEIDVFLSEPKDYADRGAKVRILNSRGEPLSGATVYHGNQVIGQTNEAGLAEVLVPKKLESSNHERILAVSFPGKVPVFLKPEDLVAGSTTEVALNADEHLIQFVLQLPPDVAIGGGNAWQAIPSLGDAGVDRGVFHSNDDPKIVLQKASWRIGWLHYRDKDGWTGRGDTGAELATVLGRPWQRWWKYDHWYSGQWKYDPSTGEWTVAVPHPGRFVIAVNQIQRTIKDFRGQTTTDWLMSPGVLIDARDVSKPIAELIVPP